MPAIVVLEILLQVAFVVHVIRTGRPQIWVYVIVLLPLAGCIAYLVAEVLPGALRSRTALNAAVRVADMIDPERDYRAAADRFADSDTVEARQALAREALRLNRPDEAIALYQGALQGIHADDPHLIAALAEAHYLAGDAVSAVDRFAELESKHPRFLSTDGRLLQARALEDAGRLDDAGAAYAALVPHYPGEEARCRYALLQLRRGQVEAGHDLFRETLRRVDRGPRHYGNSQRPWYALAKQHLG